MFEIGSFVSVRTNRWGTGKLVRSEATRHTAIVEYFDSPTTIDRPRIEVPLVDLVPVRRLESQTRVYFFDSVSGNWRMGRISGHVDTTCFVSLPNKAQAKVAAVEVFVRWNLPIADPIDHLKATLTETPFFHARRMRLVEHLTRQRAIAHGYTALLSASVFLERHQLEVVTRVLADPIQRYLLADEVGLGKTIEAGMIARQHVLDHPDQHNVVVVVPAALVSQWWYELIERCQIGVDYGHRVVVLSFDQFLETEGLAPDLLIVDEAHQVTRPDRTALFKCIRELSNPSRCAKLLLLSATPVRGNEDGFLALLHLLDPTVYRLEAVDEFRARVAQRQELADLFVTLTEEQNDYFLEQTVIGAKDLFPHDTRLHSLTEDLLASLKDGSSDLINRRRARQSGIVALRAHLAESYRLDRRLLRNRRSPAVEGLLPGRAGLRRIASDDDSINVREQYVDLWRERAAKACWDLGREDSVDTAAATALFLALLEAAWMSAGGFIRLVRRRKEHLGGALSKRRRAEGDKLITCVPLFDGEVELLNEILAQEGSFENGHDRYLDFICDAALHATEEFRRVVVMCTDVDVADSIYRRLGIRSTTPVHRCLPGSSHPQTWLKDGILICDGRAEEGLNLQGGKTSLLHVDLPLSPNRLEQRVGRLDRIGVGNRIPSLVVVPLGARFFEGWLAVLDQGWLVFDRSIASLQYVVEDEMQILRRRLFAEGSSALAETLQQLGGERGRIQTELRAIQNQDELDALSGTVTSTDALIEGIEAYEKEAEPFSQVLNLWLLDVLQFVRVGEQDASDKVGRYHYRSTDWGNQTQLSRSSFLYWFHRGIDPNCAHPAFGPPLSWPMASHRETARRRSVGVARLGHPWIDSVVWHLRWDDRGIAAALWRCDSNAEVEPKAYFRFGAIVEANMDTLAKWCESNSWATTRTVMRIADAVFPPEYVDIWIDADLLVPDAATLRILNRVYDKQSGDSNISGFRWLRLFEMMNVTGQSWMEICGITRQAAEGAVVEQHKLAELVSARLEAHENHQAEVAAQISSRLEALSDRPDERRQLQQDFERVRAMHCAIRESFEQVRVRFDSVAVTFLSRSKFE